MSIKTTYNETQGGKQEWKKIEIYFSDQWDNIKQSKTCIIEVPERGGGRANI